MTKRLTILAALAAFTMMGQANLPVAAKVDEAPKNPTVAAPVAPVINSSRFWRLVSKTQALRTQLDATDAGKALKEAEADLQAEQQKLLAACGKEFVPGYQPDTKAENAGDVICVAKPKETPAPAVEVKKEK